MRLIMILLLSLAAANADAADKIRIVASTTDLASIAAEVGGDRVDVSAICRAAQDPHRVEVLPSYMVKVSRAKLYLKVGMGLDQWADQIIDGSHSSGLQIVDCSKGVTVLEKPTGKVDASMGDIHPDGNPHYWLDPRNGAIVAATVAAALTGVDPAHAADYDARAKKLAAAAQATFERGLDVVKELPCRNVITYHRSWSYFTNAFGLEVLSTVEPIPGIPPTGKHLDELLGLIRGRKAILLIEEPYFSEDAGKFLNRETSLPVAVLSASCDDATPGSYLAHFDAAFAALKGPSVSGTPATGR